MTTPPRCSFMPLTKRCDFRGHKDFMGHTCEKLELFDIIKAWRFQGLQFEAVQWTGYEPIKTAQIFSIFSPYFLLFHDTIFIETKDGPCVVSTMSDEGIRAVRIPDTQLYDWIHPKQIKQFALVRQKTFFDRHPELK